MIAVTGANGLLGSFIVRQLIEKKETFVALKRKDSDTSLLNDVASHVTWRDADVVDEVALTEALEGVTHVIHAAAIVSFNPKRAAQLMTINVEGTRNVVNCCLAKNIQRLVHISSVAALSRQKGQTLIDETNKWTTSSLNSVYAESKYMAELEVFRGQEEGLNTVIINPSLILAPADWNKSSAQLFKYVWNEKPFYTDGYLNYVDVRDVAFVTYEMLKRTETAARFIVSAGSISYLDFFQKVAAQFGRKAPGIKISKRILYILARIERVRSWFTGGEPLITKETAQKAGADFLFSNQRIKKTLSFEFQPIEQSLQWCCQYYRDKMNGKK